MNRRRLPLALAALLIAGTGYALAETPPLVDGEVRKVDRDAGKLTLHHGPITNLDMPGMTMVFRVADPKMLDGLKPGDKLRFTAERIDGAITVTRIEPVR
ncbi:MAG: RND transporter [Rubrivivax sp. SCN 70-15]|nr:MAG: RND transporter [Rubrivivax sp. SCN 70-15]